MVEITHLVQTRKNFIHLLDSLSMEELNKIPEGSNNNIIWNFGHAVATQQLLCYALSGNETYIDKALIDKYRKGTQPNEIISEEEVKELKTFALELPLKIQADYDKGLFNNFKPYQTSYNVTLNNFEEALKFNNLHEGLHLGYAMALKRVI